MDLRLAAVETAFLGDVSTAGVWRAVAAGVIDVRVVLIATGAGVDVEVGILAETDVGAGVDAFSEGAAVERCETGIDEGAGVDSSVFGATELDAELETSEEADADRLELSDVATACVRLSFRVGILIVPALCCGGSLDDTKGDGFRAVATFCFFFAGSGSTDGDAETPISSSLRFLLVFSDF